MGLLRKAAVTAGLVETGSREQSAASYESDRPKGPGLLGRSIKALRPAPRPEAPSTAPLAIELAEKNAEIDLQPIQFQVRSPEVKAAPPAAAPLPAPRAESRFEEVLEEALSAIASLPGGVELPSRLFTVLTALLGVRKGALLLYDPVRLVYAPWAVRGYDQTTTRRMRIPLGANEAWNALGNGRPIFLTDAPALAPFQQYFSSREFAAMTRLVLVPFISRDKLIAVLELTEIDSPFSSDDELSSCLARAAEAGAPRIYQARQSQIAASGSGARPPAVASRDEPAQFVSSLGSGGAAVLLLSLSLEDYARSVLQAHEHLDPFRLHEDLVYFLGSFLVDVGKLLPVRQGRFVVALPDFDPAGLDLLTHQLSMFLQGLFGGTGTREERVLPRIDKSRSWPADGADLRTLVESLIP